MDESSSDTFGPETLWAQPPSDPVLARAAELGFITRLHRAPGKVVLMNRQLQEQALRGSGRLHTRLTHAPQVQKRGDAALLSRCYLADYSIAGGAEDWR